MAIQPETEYAKIGDDYIAYQVVGDGPIDLVYVAGLSGQIDLRWDFPPMARFLEKLASFSRLILFDRRGFGASDPVPSGILPGRSGSDDLRAVMDAVGSERAAIFGENDVTPTALLFSATFPDRIASMIHRERRREVSVLGGLRWSGSRYRRGARPKHRSGLGKGDPGPAELSSVAEDMHAIRTVARQARACITPGRAAAQYRYLFDFDLRDLLPSIHVPTLIIARTQHPYVPAAAGRYMAEHIEGARYAEFPGSDFWVCTEGADEILDVIEEFLTGAKPVVEVDRVLATVLFTDIVGSTTRAAELGDKRWKELLDRHDQLTRSIVERFGGRIVKTTGDGALATFDSPGRAIRCAGELNAVLTVAGIIIRAGLHTGEVELRGDDVGGIAVHIGARVMGEAGPGEVWCSRTVNDLVVGSGLSFADRGSHALKGVPDEWQLFAVKT